MHLLKERGNALNKARKMHKWTRGIVILMFVF